MVMFDRAGEYAGCDFGDRHVGVAVGADGSVRDGALIFGVDASVHRPSWLVGQRFLWVAESTL